VLSCEDVWFIPRLASGQVFGVDAFHATLEVEQSGHGLLQALSVVLLLTVLLQLLLAVETRWTALGPSGTCFNTEVMHVISPCREGNKVIISDRRVSMDE
jgi:hypothetical protein